jgi:hypothetical protein
MPNNFITWKMLNNLQAARPLMSTEKRKSTALTKCCRVASPKSLFFHAARHKGAYTVQKLQRGILIWVGLICMRYIL